MGCNRSSQNGVSPNASSENVSQGDPECADVMPNPEGGTEQRKPTLTDHQKKLLLSTWKVLRDDVSKVGVIMFMGVFETHPECKEAFLPFKELEGDDLRWSTELKAHGLRVMAVVERVLSRIDDDEKVEALLKALAAKHINYGAKPELVKLFGPQFVHAIQRPLQEHWSDEMQDAWKQLFDIIVYYMSTYMVVNPTEDNNTRHKRKRSRRSSAKNTPENG